MYKANVKLVDENGTLKKDIEILERRINKAVNYINDNICGNSISNAREVINILTDGEIEQETND